MQLQYTERLMTTDEMLKMDTQEWLERWHCVREEMGEMGLTAREQVAIQDIMEAVQVDAESAQEKEAAVVLVQIDVSELVGCVLASVGIVAVAPQTLATAETALKDYLLSRA